MSFRIFYEKGSHFYSWVERNIRLLLYLYTYLCNILPKNRLIEKSGFRKTETGSLSLRKELVKKRKNEGNAYLEFR
jgi:hypothetical protein